MAEPRAPDRLITDAEMGRLMVFEAYGYNPWCGFCNGACGLAGWYDGGVVHLHPRDAKAAGLTIFGRFPGYRFCVGCRFEFDGLRRKRDAEYARQHPNGPEPLLVFDPSDPHEMALGATAIGGPALMRAFGSGGGGIPEIEARCVVARECIQRLREAKGTGTASLDAVAALARRGMEGGAA